NTSTCFPVSMARGATWDPALEQRVGDVIGIEAGAQGANFFGGVCINLPRHPAWGRSQETYGEDPVLLGTMGAALVEGVQAHIMACAKHYACNSIENVRMKVDVHVDERTLREVYLPHFKRCVDAGVASVMAAYNKVNGYKCGHNHHLLQEILKDDWGFKGFVMADFVTCVTNGKAAVNGGMDLEMPFKLQMRPAKMLRMLKKGDITEDQVDESVLRILRQLIRFTRPRDPEIYNPKKIAGPEHALLAKEVAQKGMVLLKNERNLLPIDRNVTKSIAVIGDLAKVANIGDHGSSRVHPPYVITPFQGLKDIAGKQVQITYDDGSNLPRAQDMAKTADATVLVVGFHAKEEGENLGTSGGDRRSLCLSVAYDQLIKSIATATDKCIVVLIGGSAIITEEWRELVPAILMAWYPGMEGGHAIAEVIFGDNNPCGKLPLVFPKNDQQLPFFDPKAKVIDYGYYHGYKLMDKQGEEPAFPFGFGLSYTTFAYSNLQLDRDAIGVDETLQVSVEVTNTADRAGEEIVQLYVGYVDSAVDRPVKDLKAFSKVALEPGETKSLTLPLKAQDLAYYEVGTSQWVVESIEYVVFIGPSSRAADLLSTPFRVS
ncbi:MAG TPA: glycoside hydrolase family 3 C-terminal domain-containing protein, partial [Candidatus Lokiarchaeia archaeon]|nr:glycoside hydrolase family 3 C-terminal domain-containing protein [Candidatus Lokiarchaeia archaeon]